ncbi:FtsX-like permease family protein [Hydrotalea sp.]|uniref:ABC transporter permease n=1 Tax=Hydrotalea sp. TaxID=2881279 RepID=UPI002619CB95|nr:FtsX-like permease family protein [Hydrotalea sp.]
MNVAFYIARKITFNHEKTFSRFIIRLAIVATAVSVMSMIVTLAFVNGFQQTISEKVFSFWGHIRVQHFEVDKALVAEETPIVRNDTVEYILNHQPGIQQVQVFATKSAVLACHREIEGTLFKGVDAHYDSIRLKPYLQQGRWLQWNDSSYSKEIIISTNIANKLNIHLGDTLRIFFISTDGTGNTYRKLKVAGLYKTGIEEYDKLFAIGDIRLIRLINNWPPNAIGGYEVFVNNYKNMNQINQALLHQLPNIWSSKTIQEVYPNIFDWLNIQDVNRNVIFIVMSIVAIINLVTCLLILVLERTRMIGILKAIGANDALIQKIFLLYAWFIAGFGIGIGLIAGLGICWLQQYTGFLHLDESNYYVSVAPVHIIGWQVLLVCVATALVCLLALMVPTALVKKIQPVKAITFR